MQILEHGERGPNILEKCTSPIRNASKKDLVPIVVELKT